MTDFTMTIRSKDQNSNNQSIARTQPTPDFFTSSFKPVKSIATTNAQFRTVSSSALRVEKLL
jgi:hypothetical protein